ncbi:phage protease [Acinetobacter bereziniae]|uniref:Phage protease n=1 Tax=Acinetobacter bereziniae TaxID=106648 RepID=A0A8I1DJ40_ACIBZ|nr:phage protease [Acinetobacter bereziniae]QQC83003.1 hypothetical protein I9190_11810 [Acinetobacter bereziniae]UUN96152.1 phage protease [Acinetobacter bereziniae]
MKRILLAASCSFDINASSNRLVLIPEGIFKGIDGRPFDAPHWNLTPERGREIAAVLNQRSIKMVIDYEHATIKAQETGIEAPAAGWLQTFEYVDGVGLCSTQFEWTNKAKGYIESDEYKYLSPVFIYTKTGDVVALLHVALTNTPNLDQLPEAQLAAAAQNFLSQNTQIDEDSTMKEFLELMRKKLGLPETATEAELVAAANTAFAKMDGAFGTTLVADQTLALAIDKAIEVKTAANTQETVPDPTKYVPMAVYNEAVTQAKNASAIAQTKEIDDLITAACADGRLTGEATIAWYKDQAKTNPTFVKTQIENLPKIAALTQTQTSTVDLTKSANQQQQQNQPDEIAASIHAQFGLEQGA